MSFLTSRHEDALPPPDGLLLKCTSAPTALHKPSVPLHLGCAKAEQPADGVLGVYLP